MASTISPNMNLIIPTVGSEPGPDYAFDVNSSLTLIDQHDHTPGKGVQIVSAAININSALDFQNNAAINLSRVTFQEQSSPANVNQSLSVAPGGGDPLINDLYYTDSNGTQIQITENGQLAAVSTTVQGITYLTGGTFVFTQTQDGFPTRPANLDSGSITLRPNLDGTLNGVTLNAAGVSSAYSLVLPTVPLSNQFLTIDTTGVIAGTVAVSGGITGSNIASDTITSSNVRNMQLQVTHTSKSADYTAVPSDNLIQYDTTTPGHILTLYQVTGFPDRAGNTITVKKSTNDFNPLTIMAFSGEQIDEAASTTINTHLESIVLINNGNNWVIVDRTYPEVWQSATFGLVDGITGLSGGTQSSYIRRIGDSLECRVYLSNTTTAAAPATFTLPSSLTVDSSKVANAGSVLGTVYILNGAQFEGGGVTGGGIWTVGYNSSFSNQKVILYGRGDNVSLTADPFNLFHGTNTVGVSAFFTVPISGWN